MMEAGIITITAFISPFLGDRVEVRDLMPHGGPLEIYCQSSLAVYESCDVKGLYKKARAGSIKNYTGIDSPYETSLKPQLVVETDMLTLQQSVDSVLGLLQERGILGAGLGTNWDRTRPDRP